MRENDKSGYLGLTLFNTFSSARSASLRTVQFLHSVYGANLASKSRIMPGAGINALDLSDTLWGSVAISNLTKHVLINALKEIETAEINLQVKL